MAFSTPSRSFSASLSHWTSDIAGGAVVGLTVGHTVVKLNQDNRGAHIAIVSTQTGPMAALVVPFS